MFNLTKKQCGVIGDLLIGLGILVLAFLLKDSSAESQTAGTLTIIAAIFIRLQKSKKNSCRKNDNEE